VAPMHEPNLVWLSRIYPEKLFVSMTESPSRVEAFSDGVFCDRDHATHSRDPRPARRSQTCGPACARCGLPTSRFS